jgi:hypothetical protein
VALRLVNTAPGESTDAIKPGQPVHMSLKSELLKVPLASALVHMGLSNVVHHNLLPENDTVLPHLGAEITLETSERRRPIDGTTPISLVSNSIVFTKSNLLDGELGIYEVRFPTTTGARCRI